MPLEALFLTQFALSLLAWAVVARLASPALRRVDWHDALALLIAPHAFRHVGLSFLVPALVEQPLPVEFALPAAYGDLTAGLLALFAVIALLARWRAGVALAWIFSVVGIVDLMNALRHIEMVPLFGATWFIPTLLVPLLLVTHAMVVLRLVSRARAGDAFAAFAEGDMARRAG